MIPKRIHYCWFGRGEKPDLANKCIESWKKYCPDYELVEWNEDNFDVNICPYVKEAYENRKFAFVTDYVRLYALYNQGGVYMDTDVEVISSLDEFLVHRAFSGFENDENVPTGIIASERCLPVIKELLDYYTDRHFVKEDGSFDMRTNCESITEILLKHNLVLNGEFQTVADIALYPQDYFCPFDNGTGRLNKTKNTTTIHWFNKSWIEDGSQKTLKFTRILHRMFGTDFIHKLAVKLGLRK